VECHVADFEHSGTLLSTYDDSRIMVRRWTAPWNETMESAARPAITTRQCVAHHRSHRVYAQQKVT
jgi:hypothetical protein